MKLRVLNKKILLAKVFDSSISFSMNFNVKMVTEVKKSLICLFPLPNLCHLYNFNFNFDLSNKNFT